MGGGGAMRTAAKFIGIGAAAGGGAIRGFPLPLPAEHSVRKASRPVSAALTSSPPHMAKAADVEPLHTAASWDLDDWEVASDGGELIMEGGEPVPRVVFGSVPSFQEAKAATSELKEAIDKIYLSSNSSESEGSSPISQGSMLSPFHSEFEPKSQVIEASSVTSVPLPAFQAFQMLSTSHQVQTVVASLACDPNVWNAVMQNPVLKDFFQSQQSVADYEEEGTDKEVQEFSDSDSGNGFVDFMYTIMNKVSLSVAEMVSNMSSYLQNIFGLSTAEKSSGDADGIAKANFTNHVPMGGTLLGLAVFVVMVVLLKRV